MTPSLVTPLPRRRSACFALAAMFFLLVPLRGSGGCASRQACFTFSKEEFNTLGCPQQKDALPNFSDPRCPGSIISVDSKGEFDGELCCYTVTYGDIVPDCGPGAGGQAGSLNVGGFSSFDAAVTTGGPP